MKYLILLIVSGSVYMAAVGFASRNADDQLVRLGIAKASSVAQKPRPQVCTEPRRNDHMPSDLDALRGEIAAVQELVAVAISPPVYRYTSRPVKLRASRFADPGDKWTGASSACKLPEEYRKIQPTDHIVALKASRCAMGAGARARSSATEGRTGAF